MKWIFQMIYMTVQYFCTQCYKTGGYNSRIIIIISGKTLAGKWLFFKQGFPSQL